jgi:hypothetical protein
MHGKPIVKSQLALLRRLPAPERIRWPAVAAPQADIDQQRASSQKKRKRPMQTLSRASLASARSGRASKYGSNIANTTARSRAGKSQHASAKGSEETPPKRQSLRPPDKPERQERPVKKARKGQLSLADKLRQRKALLKERAQSRTNRIGHSKLASSLFAKPKKRSFFGR